MLEHLDAIRTEFIEELDKRKTLLDQIAKLQSELEEIKRTLVVIRSSYPMHNYMCSKCAWCDECTDAGNVEGKNQICSSFVAE